MMGSMDLDQIVADAQKAFAEASDVTTLENEKARFLGKSGALTELLKGLGKLDPETRKTEGARINLVKQQVEAALTARRQALADALLNQRLAAEAIDVTLPGRGTGAGSLHPVMRTWERVEQIFRTIGFDVADGPEIETDWYNFEALNLAPEHPARDMQDTLYVTDNVVLRTHTSPLQIRTMMERKPPVAAVAPGKVYRRDSDLTHTPMFHQIEGFLVDREVSMADLRGTLTSFLQQIFGKDTRVRFRPSFFPFTEPSAEVDISCCICGGAGEVAGAPCRVCKQTGWVEILGCGMIDPEVFKAVGYDPEQYTGFAFGLGVERVAMLKYGIGDLRMFFENDIRFLSQFS